MAAKVEHILSFLFLVLAQTGCLAPDLGDTRWKCASHSDCGDGFQCDKTHSFCVPAYLNEQGVFEEKLVIGLSAPLENDVRLGPFGRSMRDGIVAAFMRINEEGGIYGRKLELIAENDSNDPEKTRANILQMVEGKNRRAFALLGSLGAKANQAAQKEALNHKTLLFSVGAGLDLAPSDSIENYIFHLSPRYSQEATLLIRYLTKLMKPKVPPQNIAVFSQGNNKGKMDEFGEQSFNAVAKALELEGIPPSSILATTYDVQKPSEVQASVSELLRFMAEGDRLLSSDNKVHVGVVLISLYEPAAYLIRDVTRQLAQIKKGQALDYPGVNFSANELTQLKKIEVHFITLSSVGEGLIEMLRSFGAYSVTSSSGTLETRQFGEGTTMLLPVPHYASNAEGIKRYREDLRLYNPKLEPGFVSLEAYLNAWLLIEGLKKHGKDLTTEALIDTLETLDIDLGTGVTYHFSPSDHQASAKMWGFSLDENLQLQPLGVLLE